MAEVIAYHVIFGTHGSWLPNDPRGSWSTEVRADNIRPFGDATKVDTRRSVAGKTHDYQQRKRAKRALKYPEVKLSGLQASSIGTGFREQCQTSGYVIHACSILLNTFTS